MSTFENQSIICLAFDDWRVDSGARAVMFDCRKWTELVGATLLLKELPGRRDWPNFSEKRCDELTDTGAENEVIPCRSVTSNLVSFLFRSSSGS